MKIATYSFYDNKIRIYCDDKLTDNEYQFLKTSGFKWAPVQKLFVCPAWSPGREEKAIQLCGDILPEDKDLFIRAKERNERFMQYSQNRGKDAENAIHASNSISDGIPFGQPILVGHHSEKRHRNTLKRMHDLTAKAVDNWKKEEYWKNRADAVLRHASYKIGPAVIARRIKKLEAQKRKHTKNISQSQYLVDLWEKYTDSEKMMKVVLRADFTWGCFSLLQYPRDHHIYEGSIRISDAFEYGIIDINRARTLCLSSHNLIIYRNKKWTDHLQKRIDFETALLKQKGHGDLLKKQPRPKQKPLLNYRKDKISVFNKWSHEPVIYEQIEMSKKEYSKHIKDSKWCVLSADKTHRIRVLRVKLGCTRAVFLTDSKTHDIPQQNEKTI